MRIIFKRILKNKLRKGELNLCGSMQVPVMSCCEHGNELLEFIKCGEILKQLSRC